jgi:hypothetical protein
MVDGRRTIAEHPARALISINATIGGGIGCRS